MALDWKAKYTVKSWSTRVLFVATFFGLAFLPIKVGMFILPMSLLPGMVLMSALWPEVLTPKPLSARDRKLAVGLGVLAFVLICLACAAVELVPQAPPR